MRIARRDFVRVSSALAAAFGLRQVGGVPSAYARESDDGGLPVVWLQAQSCSGCSVSLLNSVCYGTIDDLLVNTLDLNFHGTLMPAAGNLAIAAAEKSYRRGGYLLVVEGAIPTAANGTYCYLWPDLTAQDAVLRYAKRAAVIAAVGSCASFGGMAAGAPNPTGAQGLASSYFGKRVIKIPGCPTHPDWVVGTIAYVLANGQAPTLDAHGRPIEYFGRTVHSMCPYNEDVSGSDEEASALSQPGCLEELGCNGPHACGDCASRKWNSAAKGQPGGNWCIEAGCPCIGCTEPTFPDGMSPFYSRGEEGDD